MLNHPDNQRCDSRIMSGIMARTALEHLEKGEEIEQVRNAYFFNLVRLLEMYRYNAFDDYDAQGILVREEDILIEAEEESARVSVNDVASAISNAHQSVYPQYSKDALVEYLRGLLDEIRQNGIIHVEGDDLKNLREFLRLIEENLKQ